MKTLKSIIAIVLLYVISFQLCAQNSSVKCNYQIPKKLTFQVELTLNNTEGLPIKIAEMFPNNVLKQIDSKNIYLLGEFPNEKRAESYRKALTKFGYQNTKVVAYFRQRKISMIDAKTLAHNYNRYDDAVLANNSFDTNNEMFQAEVFASNVYYSIEINGSISSSQLNRVKAQGFQVTTTKNGNYKIVTQYKSYNEVSADKKLLNKIQINGTFLTAYSNNQQIAIQEAKLFEESYNSFLALSVTE